MQVHQQTKRQDPGIGPPRPPKQQQQPQAAIGPPRPPAVGPPRPPSQAVAEAAVAGASEQQQQDDAARGSMSPPRRPGAGWMTVEDLLGPPRPDSKAAAAEDDGEADADEGTQCCMPSTGCTFTHAVHESS